MITTTTSTTRINLFGNEYHGSELHVIDRLTDEIVGAFIVVAGQAVPFDDDGFMFDFAVPFDDLRSSKAAICRRCNIDTQLAKVRWA